MGDGIGVVHITPEYGLIETESFRKAAGELADYKRLDDALTGVILEVTSDPTSNAVVYGMKDTRLLKTDEIGGLPPLRIWYRINEEIKRVELLFVEPIQGDGHDGE